MTKRRFNTVRDEEKLDIRAGLRRSVYEIQFLFALIIVTFHKLFLFTIIIVTFSLISGAAGPDGATGNTGPAGKTSFYVLYSIV